MTRASMHRVRVWGAAGALVGAVCACEPQSHLLAVRAGVDAGASESFDAASPSSPPADGQGREARAPLDMGEPATPPRVDEEAFITQVAKLLWRGAPDATLAEAVRNPGAATPQDLENVVRTALRDERSGRGLSAFTREWLDLEPLERSDDATLSDVKMKSQEVQAFVIFAYRSQDALDDFLARSPTRFRFQPSAFDPGNFEDLRLGSYEDNTRSGLLSLPGVVVRAGSLQSVSQFILADEPLYNLPARGVFVLEKVLCAKTPTLPEHPRPPVRTKGDTTVDRYRSLYEPECLACHKEIDGVGTLFEDYDRLGNHRTEENGFPTLPRWTLTLESPGVKGLGIEEFGTRVVTSVRAYQCHLAHWWTYLTGEPINLENSEQAALAERLARERASVLEVPVRLLLSEAFLDRFVVP